MTPTQKERFIMDVNEALWEQKVATITAYLRERKEAQVHEYQESLVVLRKTVLRFLLIRNVPCSPENLARLEACTDLKTFRAWLDRAFEATTEADVFG